MMTFIREVRQADPDTILLNAGDYYQVASIEIKILCYGILH